MGSAGVGTAVAQAPSVRVGHRDGLQLQRVVVVPGTDVHVARLDDERVGGDVAPVVDRRRRTTDGCLERVVHDGHAEDAIRGVEARVVHAVELDGRRGEVLEVPHRDLGRRVVGVLVGAHQVAVGGRNSDPDAGAGGIVDRVLDVY